jgi:hypothetical protein
MLFPLCPGSWHHIQNLDSFFTKISFVLSLPEVAWEGLPGAVLCGETMRVLSLQETSGKVHCGSGLFLDAFATSTVTTSGMASPVSC